MRDLRKYLVLVTAGAVTLLIGVQFVRLLEPAQARSVEAACKGLKPAPSNPAYGKLPDESGEYPKAIDFQAQNHEGEMVSLSDFRGKVVVVNFWASWCTVCKSEKPGLEALQRKFDREDLVVLALASDNDWQKVRASFGADGTPLTVLLDPPEGGGNLGKVAATYGMKAVPETFVVDRDGFLRHYFINKRDWDSSVAETCLRDLIHE